MDQEPLTILVVESRECDAELQMCILMHRWPTARLAWVDTLQSALSYLASWSPDAILLDMHLTDSIGLQTLERVHERARSVPIVVLTELDDEVLGLQAIRLGVQDYLAKISLTGDALERSLRYAIERNRLVSSIRQRDAELAHLSRQITMGEMASGLAHELKQPLTAIKNYAEASINRLSKRDEDGRQRVVEHLFAMSRQASHASDILCHMRNFVERSSPKAEEASLDEIIIDCLSLLDHELRQERVDVVLQLDPELPPVWVDRIQIKQVALNLIRNAIEAVSIPGSLRREIDLQSFLLGRDEAVFVVSDTGPGIDPDFETRIFEPFYSTKEGGMGLGLAICTSIVKAYGGSIDARRKPKGGAEFRISLPLAGSRSKPCSSTPRFPGSEMTTDNSTNTHADLPAELV